MEKFFFRDLLMTGDLSDLSGLPSAIRRLLDTTSGQGFSMEVPALVGGARLVAEDAPILDRTNRNMTRYRLQMSFSFGEREGLRT